MSSKHENWKPVLLDGKAPSVPYMISDLGRFGVKKADGKIEVRQFKATGGYYRYNTRQKGRNKAIFLFKEVARAFLRKPSPSHRFIVHKDHNYLNDRADNLKWATASEHRLHTAQSPRSVLARKRRVITKSSHSKVLNEKTVTELKKMIWDPKRKLSFRQIAERFGVSEMQIYRIKNGEFWFHIRVEHEPLHDKFKQNQRNLELAEKNSPSRPVEKTAAEKDKEKKKKDRKKHKKNKKSEKRKKHKHARHKSGKHKTGKHKKKHKHKK
ncbi:MAG TPA: hypothetical protein PLQ93_00845 [Bacteroidia bacterium]|nr:hypothetical protein [Bacteroidia bacterium]